MASDTETHYGSLGSGTASLVITSFLSIALYIVIDLIFQIFTTFKAFRSLYFWSVLVATWGIAFNATGYLLRHHELAPSPFLTATLILIGWCTMVTGQSVVLYSRLHIVLVDKKILRAILIIIIINATWLHLPVIVLVYGVNSSKPQLFQHTYDIYERIQLTVFFAQEVAISSLYLWQTRRFFLLERAIGNDKTKVAMRHLIYVNVLVIVLDISIVALEFAGLFDIQTAWKPLVYGFKLRLEFSILNKLVHLLQGPKGGSSITRSRGATQNQKDIALQRVGPQNAADPIGSKGYTVHIDHGDSASQNVQQHHPDSSVVMTTEVIVHRGHGMESHNGSLKSTTSADGEAVMRDGGGGCASSASSEVQFAKYGT